MITEINSHQKTAMFWLSNKDQVNSILLSDLKSQIAQYKKQKYLVAVFYSGTGNLLENTKSLLHQNRLFS